MARYKSNKSEGYLQALDSQSWRKFRDKYLEENPRCDGCMGRATLVHHVWYEKHNYHFPWVVSEDQVQPLCHQCHELLGDHQKGGIWYSMAYGQDVCEAGGYDARAVVNIMHCPCCGSDRHLRRSYEGNISKVWCEAPRGSGYCRGGRGWESTDRVIYETY